MSNEGYIQIIAPIIAANGNPKLWTVQNNEVKGAPKVFATIEEMVGHHPDKMVQGNPATVLNYPQQGSITEFRLIVNPALMKDGAGNSIVTLDNFSNFWLQLESNATTLIRVYQYSADGIGGGRPTYPYTLETESTWVNEFNPQLNHRWLRFRDNDRDDNQDGIFDDWSIPIPLSSFQSGDYIENRFQRYAIDENTTHVSINTLIGDKYYSVETGTITIAGVSFGVGHRFQYVVNGTYVLNGTLVETNIAPPRSINGVPNNEPAGWFDTPPNGNDLLWMITAQKSVYGQLKTDWVIRKIKEDPNYVRYNYKATPHPNDLCGITESAQTGDPADLALVAEGWVKTFVDQTFMAYREDAVTPGEYTPWVIEKIEDESGEYVDMVFKLFDLNLDPDSPLLQAPTTRNPENEGWTDAPQEETSLKINYVSEARKFFDGTLKTAWSKPVPFTGRDTFQDVIDSLNGDNFKYSNGSLTPDPTEITLVAKLIKGAQNLWEQPGITISFVWKKVYDNGAIVDVSPDDDLGSDFHNLPATGTPGTSGYFFNAQRVRIRPGAVSGKAVFRVVMTLAMAQGEDIVFEEEFSLLDITDGLDAKSLLVTADAQLIVWDSTNLIFVPANIILRAYFSNIVASTLYWYQWNGASWTSLATGATYSVAASSIFASDSTSQEVRFAVSNFNGDPSTADYDATFADFITISKLGALAIGSGEDAKAFILSNESHTVVLDTVTTQPQAGEIGASGKAKTKLEIWKGLTKQSIGIPVSGADAEITISSDTAGITFATAFGTQGSDAEKYAEIYVNTWNAGLRSAKCIIAITHESKLYTKEFTVTSTLDAPGSYILDIDSNKGFVFDTNDRTDKTFTARLYDGQTEATSDWEYQWKIDGVLLGSPWAESNKSRSITYLNVQGSATVSAEARKIAEPTVIRTRSVYVSDIADTKMQVLYWHDTNTPPVRPSKPVLDYNNAAYDGTATGKWIRSIQTSHGFNPIWMSMKAVSDPAATGWSTPVLIQGEKGDQGPNGDFIYTFYQTTNDENFTPGFGAGGNVSTIAQMVTAGWRSVQQMGSGDIVWKTEGRVDGEEVTFDVNGYPSNNLSAGAAWTTPVVINGKDGTDGAPGSSGTNGWTPILAVVSDGVRRVLQVVDYTGGTVNKPAIPRYVGATGFVTDITSAVNIRGADGISWTDADWISAALFPSFTGSLKYRKDSRGFVSLKGAVNTATTGASIFTLPNGYRPPHEINFITSAVRYLFSTGDGNQFTIISGVVRIQTNGTINLETASYQQGPGTLVSILLDRPITFSLSFDTVA